MNPIFKIIKRRLRELDDAHLQPLSGKKRHDYLIEPHILWLDELEEGKFEARVKRARWYISEMRRTSFNSVTEEDAIKLLARIDGNE